MTLEVITRGSGSRRPPLLFVHGLWHGAWCWDEHFLPWFAEQGWACHALSLRGHGQSPGRERLRRTRVRDLVEDLAEVARALPEPPVLVGHSMGGFVVQKYLESDRAAGAVLLASVPPYGAVRATLRTARRHPGPFAQVNAQLRMGPLVSTRELARDLLFSPAVPVQALDRYQPRLQDDSYLSFLDMLALDLVRTRRVARVPMLVLGAAEDALISTEDVRRTAGAYGAEVDIFDDMGHDMMLESRWESVAHRIERWLAGRFAHG